MLRAAQLASHLGSPHARSLLVAATNKAGDDASIFAAAYFQATNAGWEDQEFVATWLHRAAELSGNDGPIQRVSIREILDQKPDWERKKSEVSQHLIEGTIPLFLAARSLNSSLIDMMLLPAYSNLEESDPRKRQIIPTFSGQRIAEAIDYANLVTGLDATTLLTLSYLEILDEVLDELDQVIVPHSILIWLFDEMQRSAFHQPSRIRDAHLLVNLISSGLLEKLNAKVVEDSDLSSEVGESLALLLAEVQRDRDEGVDTSFVVRSSPVHRVSSLLEEEADLDAYSEYLCSCTAIVDKLREAGKITEQEERTAKAYLQLHEKPWPNQPNINHDAVLYLDELSINHLRQTHLINKLTPAGFRVFILPSSIEDANKLITFEKYTGKTRQTIEQIRNSLHQRILTGKVRLDARHFLRGTEEDSESDHPTFGAMLLPAKCDIVAIDDRMINRHARIDQAEASSLLICSLDICQSLYSKGIISREKLWICRTNLRRATYIHIPVDEEELFEYVMTSVVKDGKFLESAELKAIRENIERVRMSNFLRVSYEGAWFMSTINAFSNVLKSVWSNEDDLEAAKVKSAWICKQIDVRDWTHSLVAEGQQISNKLRAMYIVNQLIPPSNAPIDVQKVYSDWAENNILAPLKEQYPEVFEEIVEYYSSQFEKLISETRSG